MYLTNWRLAHYAWGASWVDYVIWIELVYRYKACVGTVCEPEEHTVTVFAQVIPGVLLTNC